MHKSYIIELQQLSQLKASACYYINEHLDAFLIKSEDDSC